ncbi:hypothetical protein Q9966_010914 [Columba livia]|nr:hypothetical protein Q9966_010914 [Columba livia]
MISPLTIKLLQGTSVSVMHVEVVAILVQDLAAISEEELMGMEVAADLVMAITDMVEDLEVATLVAVLVMEEEEEDMVEEDLAMATRVAVMEVVMTTMEEETMVQEAVEEVVDMEGGAVTEFLQACHGYDMNPGQA